MQRMHLASLLGLAILAAGVMAPPKAAATVITTADGQLGGDTWVDSNNLDTSTNGGDYAMNLYTDPAGYNAVGYARFDLGDNGIVGSQVTAASLTVWFSGTSTLGAAPVAIYALNDDPTPEGPEFWSESTSGGSTPISFQSGQTVAGNYVGTGPGMVTFLGSFSAPSGLWWQSGPPVALTVSGDDLVNVLQADTNGVVTFVVTYGGSSVADTYNHAYTTTKEWAGYAPTLDVTSVPEPASLGLAAVGALVLCRRRRH